MTTLSYIERQRINETELLALAAGDEVALYSAYNRAPTFRKVSRVTKTRIFLVPHEISNGREPEFHRIAGQSFRAGAEVGTAGTDRSIIRALTPALRAELDAAKARAERERDAHRALDCITGFLLHYGKVSSSVPDEMLARIISLGKAVENYQAEQQASKFVSTAAEFLAGLEK